MLRRTFIALVSILAVAPGALAQSADANWPTKPVRVVVPFAAGGVADNLGRQLAQRLSQSLGQQFVVENVTGAGGNIGAAEVARAASDGYTLLMGTIGTHSINPLLFKNLPYDPKKDFRPISLVATSPNLISVTPSSSLNSIADLIAFLKENPDKLSYATGGAGSSQHLAGEMFKAATGTQMLHIAYRGSPAALNDVMGGRVDITIDNFSTSWPLASSGKLKALAVTGAERSPLAPDVPTVGETLPGFEAISWHAMYAPAGVPDAIAEKLSREVQAAMRQPDLVDTLAKTGIKAVGSTPEELSSYMDEESAKWSKVVQEANITVE